MKLIQKIVAFFKYRGEEQAVEAKAAEIKRGMVYLHPTDDPDHIICIRSSNVGVMISPDEELSDEDVFIVESKNSKVRTEEKPLPQLPIEASINNQTGENATHPQVRTHDGSVHWGQTAKYTPLPVKRISLTFYADEYEELNAMYKEFNSSKNLRGYNKAEFFLACVKAAKKTSMESIYKQYNAKHKKIRAEEREAKKRFAEVQMSELNRVGM